MKKTILAFFLIFLLAACNGNVKTGDSNDSNPTDKESEVIKIGAIVSKTGKSDIYGDAADKGIKLAVDEINENGGIDGNKIEYILEDDKSDPVEAVKAYDKLIEKNADAIIGPISSENAKAVANKSSQKKTVIISPTAGSESITEDSDNIFRTCFTNSAQGKVLANFSTDILQAKSAAILRNKSSDYSNEIADAFKDQFTQRGLKVLSDEGYEEDDFDLKTQLENIKKENPDLILIPENSEKDFIIAKEIREAQIDAKIIGSDGWEGVLDLADKSSEKVLDAIYFASHYASDDQSETVKEFVDSYQAKYKKVPSSFSALAYDSVYILKDAFEKSNSTDSEKLIETIKNVEVDGVTGNIRFDEKNNPYKSVVIIKIENGKYNFDSLVSPE